MHSEARRTHGDRRDRGPKGKSFDRWRGLSQGQPLAGLRSYHTGAQQMEKDLLGRPRWGWE